MSSRVAIITGYFKSPSFLKILFQYLERQTFKEFDVYVYHYQEIEDREAVFGGFDFKYNLIYLNKNVGFAGGNNAAIKAAREKYDYEYYALINDDTKPERDWLLNLVGFASKDEKVGVVSSKLVYYEKFLIFDGEITSQNDSIEGELLASARLYNNTSIDQCVYPKRFYYSGFGVEEEDEIFKFRRVNTSFRFALPVTLTKNQKDVKLRIFIRPDSEGQALKLSVGSLHLDSIELQRNKIYYEQSLPIDIIEKNSVYIIQNAGSDFDECHNGYDIGSGDIESEEYNTVKELKLFCGGACLITKDALHKAGLFEELFFSYYEDSDLSLRIRREGFKIMYNPNARVMHYHSATSVEWSPFFTYHVFRNKLIFAYQNFGVKAFYDSYQERCKETWYFLKLSAKRKFRDVNLNARLRLNISILKDSIVGIVKYSPTKFK